MSRGGIWLTAGILCIIAGFCAGAMFGQAVFDAMGKEEDFGQTAQRFSKLVPLAMLANLAFYGGIIAAIIGVVLLIVDRGQQSKSLSQFSEIDLRHDYAIDVCISHPTESGTRSKHFFTTSKQLVATLVEWKQQGHQDIILTWGKTDEKLVPIIVAQIRRAGEAEYRGPRGGYCKRGVIGGRPLAIGLVVLAVLIAAIFFFGFWLTGWMDIQQKHKDFDREWEQRQKEHEDFKKKLDEYWNRNRGF